MADLRCQVRVAELAMLRGSHEALLDEAERARAAAFARPDDRARFVRGTTLLRRAPDLVSVLTRMPPRSATPRRALNSEMRLLYKGFPVDQPLIGLLAGLDDKARFPRDASIMQLAEASLATIRSLQPPGVGYRLAGYSMAGLIAYELFVTEMSLERAVPLLGWSDIHPGPVQIREIGGDHMSIMQGDAARRLADALVKAQPE